MQKLNILKQLIVLLGLLPPMICGASNNVLMDGYDYVLIKEATVQGEPKSSAIQASINGHLLTVAFSENLGQVAIEVTTASGSSVEYISIPTPNGVQFYIFQTGDYVITFTLPNGDEYYGEFTVTD